jgi:hypothetical protein
VKRAWKGLSDAKAAAVGANQGDRIGCVEKVAQIVAQRVLRQTMNIQLFL